MYNLRWGLSSLPPPICYPRYDFLFAETDRVITRPTFVCPFAGVHVEIQCALKTRVSSYQVHPNTPKQAPNESERYT